MAENPALSTHYETYIGKTLGNYYLEQLSESLETGPVFQARDTRAKTAHRLRLLALPAGLTAEERLVYLGHFQREAGQLAALQHASLLPLIDYGIYQGIPYLVSPELPLSSLRAFFTQRGPGDAVLVGRYLDQVAAALEYMHQQGILHLNVNIRNVFVRMDGRLTVAEAGLVRMLAPQADVSVANQRSELENGSPLLRDKAGRPLYGLSLASSPAPELLRGQPVDTSTDVYTLGALLYQLLTGHRVLRAGTLPELARQHIEAAVPALSTWRQDLPAELDQLLSRAMEKNPARRFRSPGALANAYAQVVSPGEIRRRPFLITAPPSIPARSQEPQSPVQAPARPAGVPARTDTRARSPLSRRRAITLLAAGGGVAAAAGVAVWFVERTASSASVANPGGASAPVANGSSGGSHGKVLAHVADVPVNSAKTFPLANSNNPGVLIHLPNNQFVAFNSTCTHAGCAVHYNPQDHLLECPCHQAAFDPARNAAVVAGPAPSPLSSIGITVNADGTITENG